MSSGVPNADEILEMDAYEGAPDESQKSTSSDQASSSAASKRALRGISPCRQKADSEEEDESPTVDFTYDDEDTTSAELAELYSYTENADFGLCQKAFEDFTTEFDLHKTWSGATPDGKTRAVHLLLDQLDHARKEERQKATRALLYLAQGCWLECQSDTECLWRIDENVRFLHGHGAFTALVELLNLEIENEEAASNALRKLAISLADSVELRVILSVLYTMTLVLRKHPEDGIRDGFVNELNTPVGGELLAVRLLTMVTRFCSGSAPHFPMKKCLLLLWKVLLTSLGGMDRLREMKVACRRAAGLRTDVEDTLSVSQMMRPVSPPAIGGFAKIKKLRDRLISKRNTMAKQGSLEDAALDQDCSDEQDEADFNLAEAAANTSDGGGYELDSPRPGTPVLAGAEEGGAPQRCLPWKPKVRQKELDGFLEQTRMKFVGFGLNGDTSTMAGLPQPIHESIQILQTYLYKSLGEVQVEAEGDLAKYPVSKPEAPVDQTPAEILYQSMFLSLPQYMIALLKILLAAAPTSKAKTDSINIVTDVLPEEMPMTVAQSLKLGIDVNRHKEIIVKAVSSILLLLLKHFRMNHVYQFEFMSQHLVFANCIPLVLKILNQNITAHVASRNNISHLEFPLCVIGYQPPPDDFTWDNLDASGSIQPDLLGSQSYCWRNMFSCINLLRVLNKLTKWKRSRIMMMVVFKSAPILKRTLKVKHAMLQLYVLKLLKMQSKYLGRQWRKSNMKTVSAIYTKVRHRLNEDWAYGNDVESRPWDFQAEECSLRCAVDRFNHRRYERPPTGSSKTPSTSMDQTMQQQQQQQQQERGEQQPPEQDDLEPVDNCLNSVLGQEVELTDEFKANYEKWLQREVFNTEIRWEMLLSKHDREAMANESFLCPPT